MSKRIGAVVLALSCACGSDDGGERPKDITNGTPNGEASSGGDAASAGSKQTVVQIGDDVPAGVKERFVAHMNELAPGAKVVPAKDDLSKLGADSRIIAIGSTWATGELVPQADVDALAAEGYVLRTGAIGQATAIVTKGKARTKLEHGNAGNAFGAFALLEELGMGFLHPLAPTTPKAMTVPAAGISRREEPRWPTRGIQLHTMHPLELTHLLEGWGPAGPNDEAGWNAMLPEWDRFLEWMLANGQNRVHWVLLEATSWKDFAQSETRRLRLKKLVDRAHAFDIAVGADVPIVLQQQHTFRLITKMGALPDELAQLRSRVDWLMSAGYDYLATENGTTEFTHPGGGSRG
jgi:hypothetical protein